jgi:hypothetical protein
MRFTTAFVAGALAVVARAQSETTVETPTNTYSLDPVQSSIYACIGECDPSDTACLARCNPVPNPSEEQVNDTNACFAKCPQGDGTESETQAYIDCTTKCTLENFFDPEQGTPSSGGGSNNDDDEEDSSSDSPNTTGTDSPSATESGDSDDSEESGSETSGTSTGDADNAEETGEGDDDSGANALFGSYVALFGAVAAALAL